MYLVTAIHPLVIMSYTMLIKGMIMKALKIGLVGIVVIYLFINASKSQEIKKRRHTCVC